MAKTRQSSIDAKTDGTGIAMALASSVAAHGNYLGDIKCVSGVFRRFGGEIVLDIVAVSEGKMTPDAAAAKEAAEVNRLLREFRGKGEMSSVGPWNEGNGLANFIRRTLPNGLLSDAAKSDNDVAVQEALAIFTLCIRQAVVDAWEQADTLMDDCSGICDDWSRLFVGLPPDGEGL